MVLLADTVCLLRAQALLKNSMAKPPLTQLIPRQLPLGLD
jgi:hypothetical protein